MFNDRCGSCTLSAFITTPVGAIQQRTMESVYKVEYYFLAEEQEAAQSMFAVQRFSFAGSGQNNAPASVKLKDWGERESEAPRQARVRAGCALQSAADHHGRAGVRYGRPAARRRERRRIGRRARHWHRAIGGIIVAFLDLFFIPLFVIVVQRGEEGRDAAGWQEGEGMRSRIS